MPPARARTTITLPPELLTALDQAIQDGLAGSRDEFLVTAVRSQLAECRRAKIDAAFEAMATDPEYQEEATEIAEEFASSDWEAFQHAGEMLLRRGDVWLARLDPMEGSPRRQAPAVDHPGAR